MSKEIKLDQLIETETTKVMKLISLPIMAVPRAASRTARLEPIDLTLYQKVLREFSDSTRNSPDQIKCLQAYETALAVFRVTALELRKEMDVLTLEQQIGAQEVLQERLAPLPEATETKTVEPVKQIDDYNATVRRISDCIFFSNRYALYFAGQIGLALLGTERAEGVKKIINLGPRYESSKERDDITRYLADETVIALDKFLTGKKEAGTPINDESLKSALQSVFTAWVNQFNWNTYKEIAAQNGEIGNLKLKYGLFSMEGGLFKRKNQTVEIDERLLRGLKEDVIGAEGKDNSGEDKLGTLLWKNFKKLTCYDPETRSNDEDPLFSVFTFGEPGCGKTFVSNAYLRSFGEFCQARGTPLWVLTHSTTDYASSFQNETANKLAKLAAEINRFEGIVIMYVADADNLFVSRRSAHITPEQQQTMSVYFKMFDGTLIPKNGKFMAIMDANYIDGIDEATKSRLFSKVVEMNRFDQAEDFAELARKTITKKMAGVKITPEQWLEIGEYILNTPLSHREVDHVLKSVYGDYDLPEELIGKPKAERLAFKQAYIDSITAATVIERFDNYIRKVDRIEKESLRRKIESDADRFDRYLSQPFNGTNSR